MIEYLGHKIEWVPTLRNSKKAIYLQIAESIEEDIRSGKLPTGYKLPPQRLIANYLNINHSTVTKAYKYCEAKGIIHGVMGKGTFVSNTFGIPETVLSESKGKTIEMGLLQPLYETNDLLASMIEELSPFFDKEVMYKYSDASGNSKHKHIASKWLKKLNIYSDPDRMIITSGAQNALFTILMTDFNNGDKIAVDELTYTGIRNSAIQLGIDLIPIEGDDDGMLPLTLEKAIIKYNIKGIYVIPDCHNPTTNIMSMNRRNGLAHLIQKYNLIAIEDSVFRFTTNLSLPTIYSLVPKNCYHIASISKMINPGFRIAYLLLPEIANYKRLVHSLHNLLFMPSSITAEIVSCLQSSHKLDELLEIRRKLLINKNKIFDKVFQLDVSKDSSMSLFRFITIPQKLTKNIDIEKEFLKFGIQIYSADRFRILGDRGITGIRVSISSSESDKTLEEELLQVKRVILL
ncbi:aminotransferase-like domain-containing protein [Alkaliphilus hydrothermalis]|uniref:DNA-binding transcriptional MocR family regulator n=1 Tax=Alkaliphilus hydrothermalis TaxID=1482730 RepID=A0ABS2NSE2_9FIRM|nr:PLP-dependent aminotransferase family protein [Alkaliphilus hydrothermalis]MBM7615856.1 DNA-binding transcriptional MocR family regulator [Alkaliphilus hydrothermalis]